MTGDQGLKNEGHAHQAKGSLKKAVDKVAETVKGHNPSNERGVAMNTPSRHPAADRRRAQLQTPRTLRPFAPVAPRIHHVFYGLDVFGSAIWVHPESKTKS